jgi:MFS transporter, MHS family, citrate/tricarballylate:H+ symporter
MTAATPAVEPGHQSKFMTVLRVTSGNFLEQFDFFLFGFYATYIAEAFFPAKSEFASLMLTFAVFGAGFLMRPLGGIVLGAYIDKVGRRRGLIATLSIMASGTMLLAFVPDYATIGLAAPLLVLIGRLLQGFSAGAELGGVSVYLSEMATPGHKGFYTSWQSASQQISIVLAAVLGYVLNEHMSKDDIMAWGWRIPFFVGCAIVPVIFVLRRTLLETEEFKTRAYHPSTHDVLMSMLKNWSVVIQGMLLVAMTTTTFYLITVYTPTFGRTVLKLSSSDSLIVTFCVAVLNFILLPVGGALSDKIGRQPILIGITVLAILTAYPALAWLVAAPDFQRMLIVLLYFSVFFGIYNGAMIPALTEVMPVQVRVAGFSLAYSLATALFGGMTPVISTYLIEVTKDKAAPAIWLSVAAVCGLIGTILLYRRKDWVRPA